jgi:hypothetical protein
VRLVFIVFAAALASAECLPIAEAPKRIGQTTCIRGTVVKVTRTESGTHFLNFCDDWQKCPFSAVVFAKDLRQVGDVRNLEGKEIEIHGQIQLYQGRPEVMVRDSRQLKGQAAHLPPMPKTYDVERHGKYSAGQRPTHTKQKTQSKHRPARGADTIPEVEPQPVTE